MAVSKNTLRTNAWDVVYTYLQTTNALSTNNIHSSLNSKLVSSEGYPQVLIQSPTTTSSKLSVDGTLTYQTISITIEVYHLKNADCKALADEVVAKLHAGRTTFAGQRLVSMSIDDIGSDSWEEGSKTIHRIAMEVGFRNIG